MGQHCFARWRLYIVRRHATSTVCNAFKTPFARAVTQASWRSSATEFQWELDWLPIRQRVEFKIGVNCWQSHWLRRYTALSCHWYQPSTVITDVAIKHCSASASTVCSIKLLHARTHFPLLFLLLWKWLPPSICNTVTLSAFRSDFQTLLFNHAFTP